MQDVGEHKLTINDVVLPTNCVNPYPLYHLLRNADGVRWDEGRAAGSLPHIRGDERIARFTLFR